MQFRVEAEALNALNHTQFGGPDTNNQAGSSFGAITSTGVSAQQVEDFKPPLATAILTSDSPPGLSDFFGPAGAASVFQNPERIQRAKPLPGDWPFSAGPLRQWCDRALEEHSGPAVFVGHALACQASGARPSRAQPLLSAYLPPSLASRS